ncbi:hypothetical protein MMPV_009635 [Pyropia vietnamensis]
MPAQGSPAAAAARAVAAAATATRDGPRRGVHQRRCRYPGGPRLVRFSPITPIRLLPDVAAVAAAAAVASPSAAVPAVLPHSSMPGWCQALPTCVGDGGEDEVALVSDGELDALEAAGWLDVPPSPMELVRPASANAADDDALEF